MILIDVRRYVIVAEVMSMVMVCWVVGVRMLLTKSRSVLCANQMVFTGVISQIVLTDT